MNKIVQTKVTDAQLVAAQGGVDGNEFEILWVRCPAEYDVAAIEAIDIIEDEQIVVVSEPAEAIERELERCETEAIAQGHSGEGWMPTEADLESVIAALGYKPTREQWEEGGRRWGIRWVGSAHCAEAAAQDDGEVA